MAMVTSLNKQSVIHQVFMISYHNLIQLAISMIKKAEALQGFDLYLKLFRSTILRAE